MTGLGYPMTMSKRLRYHPLLTSPIEGEESMERPLKPSPSMGEGLDGGDGRAASAYTEYGQVP